MGLTSERDLCTVSVMWQRTGGVEIKPILWIAAYSPPENVCSGGRALRTQTLPFRPPLPAVSH